MCTLDSGHCGFTRLLSAHSKHAVVVVVIIVVAGIERKGLATEAYQRSGGHSPPEAAVVLVWDPSTPPLSVD